MPNAAETFAVVTIVLLIAHEFGDHWTQTQWQATNKHLRNALGRRACAAHVLAYTIGTTLAVLGVWLWLRLPISPAGLLAGQLISAITHYLIDRRFMLERLTQFGVFEQTGRHSFYQLGQPRPGHDDNAVLGTGAYALDQSLHKLCLGMAGVATTAIQSWHSLWLAGLIGMSVLAISGYRWRRRVVNSGGGRDHTHHQATH